MTDWLCACANQGADVARCTIIRVDHLDGTATLGLVDTEALARDPDLAVRVARYAAQQRAAAPREEEGPL